MSQSLSEVARALRQTPPASATPIVSASVAEHGLRLGEAAVAPANSACAGLRVRALEPVPSLVLPSACASALECLSQNDRSSARRMLQHDEAGSSAGFVALWLQSHGFGVPPSLASLDDAPLSERARLRASLKPWSPLPAGVLIEHSPDGLPVLSASRYQSASSLAAELLGYDAAAAGDVIQSPDELGSALGVVDLSMVVESDAGWQPVSSAIARVDASGKQPSAVVMLQSHKCTHSGAIKSISASFAPFEQWCADMQQKQGSSAQLPVCRDVPVPLALQDKHSQLLLCADASISELARGFDVTEEHSTSTAINNSRVTKSIRRGRQLAGPRMLLEACDNLLQENCNAAGELAFNLLNTALIDVCPFTNNDQSETMSMPELVGIALLARAAGPSVALPAAMSTRMKNTALALQFADRADCLSEWRGWRSAEKPAARKLTPIEGNDDSSLGTSANFGIIRDALRCMYLGHPYDTPLHRNATLRHLGALLGHLNLEGHSLMQLQKPTDTEKHNAQARLSERAEREALLAAHDHIVFPSILIRLQATMPFAPSHPAQHALRALAKLIDRLSSGVNLRNLKRQKLGAPALELFRIQQFAMSSNKTSSSTSSADDPEAGLPYWGSQWEPMQTTEHERMLLQSLHSLQEELAGYKSFEAQHDTKRENVSNALKHDPDNKNLQPNGRNPTPNETRTAFLMLFAKRQFHDIVFTTSFGKELSTSVACSLSGTQERPLRVQRISSFVDIRKGCTAQLDDQDSIDYGGAEQMHQFVERGPILEASVAQFVRKMSDGITVTLPKPPPGFQWKQNSSGEKTVTKVWTDGNDSSFHYAVDHKELPAFNAASLLTPNNEPTATVPLQGELLSLLRQAFYSKEGTHNALDQVELLRKLQNVADRRRRQTYGELQPEVVPEVLNIAIDEARVPQSGWRDCLVKMTTREAISGRVNIPLPDHSGERSGSALNQMTEGLTVRLLTALEAVYPEAISHTSDSQMHIDDSCAAFYHLHARVSILAFGSWHEGANRFYKAQWDESRNSYAIIPISEHSSNTNCLGERQVGHSQTPSGDDELPYVETPLWKHQEDGTKRIMSGIRDSGKRGFADASAVGAGKTLTAISSAIEAWRFLRENGIQRSPILVLVPNRELITEWSHQLCLHTNGVKVLLQTSSGLLISRGVSRGIEGDKNKRNNYTPASIDHNSFVVTTLSRAREHPFKKVNMWSIVIIDECLSVQNDTALQTVEAWRNVEASQLGCFMLSATFFRSSFAKLAYMLRMLGTALPLSPAYLLPVLSEHIISYVPESKRRWKLEFVPVTLPENVMKGYYKIVSDFHKNNSSSDRRRLYSSLKSYLKQNFEASTLLESFSRVTQTLVKQNRRPILFATSDAEANNLLERIPNARMLNKQQLQQKQQKQPAPGPLIVTVQRAAHGLNLQDEGDAIVTRPQPGDVLEQMKGRIDRPGQKKNDLKLHVLYADATVEEAEASNVRLCGRFVREWIWPLSYTFQERAGSAALSAYIQPSKATSSASVKKGKVAQAFMKTLEDEETLSNEMANPDSVTNNSNSEYMLEQLQGLSEQSFEKAIALLIRRESDALAADGDGKSSLNVEHLSDDDIKALHKEVLGAASAPDTKQRKRKASEESATSVYDDAGDEKRRQESNSSTRSSKSSVKQKKSTVKKEGKRKREDAQSGKRVHDYASGKKGRRKAIHATIDDTGVESPTSLEKVKMHEVLEYLSNQDEKLSALIAQIGLPTSLLSSLGGSAFPSLARAIIYQQLSTKAASSIFKRVLALCGGEEGFTPEHVLQQEHSELRKAGLSERKVEYLNGLAQGFTNGQLSTEKLRAMSDLDVLDTLTSIKGLGEWSVTMFLMFSLGRLDVLPVGDLAVRKGMKRLYGINGGVDEASMETATAEHVALPTREEMLQVAERWRPYRTVGTWFMWCCCESDAATYTYWPEGSF